MVRLRSVILMLPFWSTGTIVPITFGSDQNRLSSCFSSCADSTQRDFAIANASKLGLQLFATLLMIQLAEFFFYGLPSAAFAGFVVKNPLPYKLNIPNLYDGFPNALAASSSSLTFWVSACLGFIVSYARLNVFMNTMVMCGRLAGASLQSDFIQPWRASSFGEFYSRIIFYYGNIIAHIYLPLFKDVLRLIHNKSVRAQLALFLALTIGGFHFHLIRDYRIVFRHDFATTLLRYLPTLGYFSAVGLLIVASSRLRRRGRLKGSSWLNLNSDWRLRVFFYVLAWAIVYSSYIATYHAPTSLEVYGAFLRRLFFID